MLVDKVLGGDIFRTHRPWAITFRPPGSSPNSNMLSRWHRCVPWAATAGISAKCIECNTPWTGKLCPFTALIHFCPWISFSSKRFLLFLATRHAIWASLGWPWTWTRTSSTSTKPSSRIPGGGLWRSTWDKPLDQAALSSWGIARA